MKIKNDPGSASKRVEKQAETMGSLEALRSWIEAHELGLKILAIFSVVTFIGSLIAVPWLVVRLPEDYFVTPRRQSWVVASGHPLVHWLTLIAKNALGCLLLGAGVSMLVLPGQGLLTIVVGLLLIDFPGKYRLERWIVSRPAILRSLNWLRARRGHPPLRL